MNVNGREFEFKQITMSQQEVIQKKFSKTPLWMKIVSKRVEVDNPKGDKPFVIYVPRFGLTLFAQLTWRRLCRIMFVMDFTWKYLHRHPKELSFDRMLAGVPEEIKASFFAFYRDEVQKAQERLKPFADMFRKDTM